MPMFSKTSKERLATCHPDLIEVLEEAIKHRDFVVVCGYRSNEDQQKAFDEGKSKAKPGQSKHNLTPSMAVDIAPYNASLKTIDWTDAAAFARLAGVIEGIAISKGIKVRLGLDWDNDGATKDERLFDAPHIELAD